MQALKDAGIVLIVILLLVSVRVSPMDDAGAATDASLMPSVEAAPAVDSTPTVSPAWVLSSDDGSTATPDIETVERCTEILFLPQDALETTQVVKVLPCSA